MPAASSSLAITRRYQDGMVALRKKAQAEARDTWGRIDSRDLTGTYNVGMLTLSVSTLQREAARLSAGYVQAFVSSELGRPIPIPLVDARQVGKARNGDVLRRQLMSPLIGVKADIGNGKDVDLAIREGGRTLERVVGLATDTAARESLRLALQDSPYVGGWRRAIRGTCGACIGAADGVISSEAQELDIHPNCGCVSEPVVKAEPYKPKKNERIEVQNGLELVKGKWVRVDGAVRGKVVKFDAEKVMIDAGTAKKPRWISAKVTDAYKPGKQVVQKLDDLAHGETAFMNALSKAEYDAIGSYKGYGYKQVNASLRAGKPGGKVTKALDTALEKGSLGSDTKLYRSFHFPADRGVGDVFSDKAFMSTSRKRDVAGRFETTGGKRSLVRINAPKGTKGAHLPGQNEEEFLLPRNTRLRITGDKIEGGVRVLDAEIVPNG
jgi:hypothetical protein